MTTDNQYRTLSAPREIFSYLNTACKQRESVSLLFKESDDYFRSSLVEVDLNKKCLQLDSLIPTRGNKLIRNSSDFHVITSIGGVQLRFISKAPAMAALGSDGKPCYILPLPDEMLYLQRRDTFRVATEGSTRVITHLTGSQQNSQSSLQGNLEDVSAGGCRVKLKDIESLGLQTGEILDSVKFMVPNLINIDCKAELRHIAHLEDKNTHYLGLKFVETTPLQQRQLDRFINQLQRDARL